MTITEQTREVATETTPPEDRARYLCRHVHADGRRCGSRSLRQQNFCYYHTTNRPPVQNPRLRKQESNEFALTDPTDRTALQLTLGEVLRLIFANQIDPRRAGLLLYGLQIASCNIPKPKPDDMPSTIEEVVEDPELGLIAPEAEAAPWPWTVDEWDQKHKLEALRLKINQKLVEECDARIKELENKHAQEVSAAVNKRAREALQKLMDLHYEIQCLRSTRHPHLATRMWGENSLEELDAKRAKEAKQLAESAAKSAAKSATNSRVVSDDAELDREDLDSESDKEDDDMPIIPHINGSAHEQHRSRPALAKLLAPQRAQSLPPRKSVAKRKRRSKAIASRSRAAKMGREMVLATGDTATQRL